MSPLVKPQSNSHWYNSEGEPCYEVPYADPKKGMRKTTLKDARKLGLFPSVTNVLGVIHKPQLEAWKIEQGITAALTLPQLENEPLDDFAKRVVQDASEVASKAADFGTAVHHAIEDWLKGDELTQAIGPKVIYNDYNVSAHLKAYTDWHQAFVAELLESESPFVNLACGYGGKRDMVCYDNRDANYCFIDIKTTKTKPGEKVKGYQEQGMQLAAYAGNLQVPEGCRLINVFLSSTEPGRLEVIEWTDQRERLFDGFLKALALWKWLKNYDPLTSKKAVA